MIAFYIVIGFLLAQLIVGLIITLCIRKWGIYVS